MISENTIVDMHIHSTASDSTDTPQEIIDTAIAKNIGIISLTDHNSVENQKEFLTLAKKSVVKAISGVEISCKTGNMVYHILAYGFNPDDIRVAEFVAPMLSEMKANNRILIGKMVKDFPVLSLAEYDDYTYDRTRGGWEYVNYLYDKGITDNSIDGLAYYTTYDCRLSNCAYPSPGEVINKIKSFGAFSILAHPNRYFNGKNPDLNSIINLLDKMKEDGIDGVECYYPSHSEFLTKTTVDWCNRNGMMITSGSDSHGKFVPGIGIGKIRVPLKKINIDKILNRE